MQSFFEPTPPAPLSETYGIEHYTLESPLAIVLVLMVAAGVCWVVLRPSRRRVGTIASLSLALAGLGLLAAAHFIDTPREQVTASVSQLVDAVASADTRRADALLAPGAAIYDFERSSPVSKDEILSRISSDFARGARYELDDHAVLVVQVAFDSPTAAKTQVKVRVSSKAWGGPYFSWWRMDLARDGAGPWRITGIQPLVVPGMSGY
ncbi:MAG: DUF4440 domain-containing protein [Tepidisphaera sp.]|nr:DUF4440 domain-containing protein [Tepidisphaera sp.]